MNTPTESLTSSRRLPVGTHQHQMSVESPHFQHGFGQILSPTGRSVLPSPYSDSSYATVSMPYYNQFSPVPMPFGYTPPPTNNQVSSPFQSTNAYNAFQSSPDPSNYCSGTGTPDRDAYNHSTVAAHYGTPGRRQNAMRVSSRSPTNSAASHHNVVDIARIQEGSDVRTTVRAAIFGIFRA